MSATRSILCLAAIAAVVALRATALQPKSARATNAPDNGTQAASTRDNDRAFPGLTNTPPKRRTLNLPLSDPLINLNTSLSIRPLHTLAEAAQPADGREDHAGTPGSQTEPFAVPSFEPIRFSMRAPPLSIQQLEAPPDDLGPFHRPSPSSDVLFRFNRNTNLSDGGITDTTSDRLPSENDAFADASAGERFNRYSMNIEWVPTGSENQLQWLVVGGVQAIKADIGRLDDASLGLTQARGTVAIPTVGTGLRWSPAESFSISTLARTQTIQGDASMTNLIISADLMLSRTVGFSAGYEFFESSLTVESVNTQIDREGYFARLTIRF